MSITDTAIDSRATHHAMFGAEVRTILDSIGVARKAYEGGALAARSPINGEIVGRVPTMDAAEMRQAIDKAIIRHGGTMLLRHAR